MEIVIANKSHIKYADLICETISESANVRGTGIARRSVSYIIEKMEQGNAIIALDQKTFVGFCYIEAWSHGKFVANSGLIIHPDYRGLGISKKIKNKIFEHSRTKYPHAKIFSITTGIAVMKLNSELGYKPVPFSELTKDQTFWNGCQTCKNYDVLQRTKQQMCLCTGMLYDPNIPKPKKTKNIKSHVVKRLKRIKESIFLNKVKK